MTQPRDMNDPGKAAAMLLGPCAIALIWGVAKFGDTSTATGRTWVFLGSQTLFEAFFVMRAFWGKPFPGLGLRELRGDWGRRRSISAWALAALIVLVYCGLEVSNDFIVASTALAWNALKAAAILTAVVTGFLEEGFFRRFFMDSLNRKGYGVAVQVLASGLGFGIVHAGWALAGGNAAAGLYAVGWTCALGTSLALVYLLGGRNLWPCIAAHFLINMILEPGLALSASSGFK